MTVRQHPKRVQVTAVHVHPFYYHTVYGPKRRLEHLFNQVSRAVAMVFYFLCFLRFAMMAPDVPALVHLPILAVLLAIIILLGNQINRAAAGRRNFRKFEALKKSTVIYTRNKKLRCANDNG